MIDLKKVCGFNAKYDKRKNILFVDGKKHIPDARVFSEMKDVLADSSKFKSTKKNKPFYYMFRDAISTSEMKKNNLRYDITCVPSMMIGKEFNKTYGHYHELASKNTSYPEVYEVLHGTAFYLLQKKNKKGDVLDVLYFIAKKGDKVFIPPNYGHTTINPSSQVLIMSNLVEANFKSIYLEYKSKKGAAYYVIKDKVLSIYENPKYKRLPAIRGFVPKDFKKLFLQKKTPLFAAAKKDPKKFKYLVYPAGFLKDFKAYFRE